jgi:hypothetical protein
LLKEFLQGKGDFLLVGEGVASAKDVGVDGGEAIEGDADASAGDFFGQLIDGETDGSGGIVLAGPNEMRGDAGQDIAEAEDDFLRLFAGLWSGILIAGGGHCRCNSSKYREKSEGLGGVFKKGMRFAATQ